MSSPRPRFPWLRSWGCTLVVVGAVCGPALAQDAAQVRRVNVGFNTLKNTATQLGSDLGGMINQLDTAMRDAGKALFGQELNELVNGAGCSQSAISGNDGQTSFSPVNLQNQLKCAQGLAANLERLCALVPVDGLRDSSHGCIPAGFELPRGNGSF